MESMLSLHPGILKMINLKGSDEHSFCRARKWKPSEHLPLRTCGQRPHLRPTRFAHLHLLFNSWITLWNTWLLLSYPDHHVSIILIFHHFHHFHCLRPFAPILAPPIGPEVEPVPLGQDAVTPISISVTIHLKWTYHQLLHRNQPLTLRPVSYSNMISSVFNHKTVPAQAIWIKKLERRASTKSWQTSMIETTDAIDSSANTPQDFDIVRLDWWFLWFFQ